MERNIETVKEELRALREKEDALFKELDILEREEINEKHKKRAEKIVNDLKTLNKKYLNQFIIEHKTKTNNYFKVTEIKVYKNAYGDVVYTDNLPQYELIGEWSISENGVAISNARYVHNTGSITALIRINNQDEEIPLNCEDIRILTNEEINTLKNKIINYTKKFFQR